MTKDELLQVADDYVATKKEVNGMTDTLNVLKTNIVDELKLVDDVKFDFGNGLKAAKQERKGIVDMKALQIKYNISDSDLDTLRKASATSWVLTVK